MRINRTFSFLIIICCFLSVFLHTIPQGLAARELLQDINPPNSNNSVAGEGYGGNNSIAGEGYGGNNSMAGEGYGGNNNTKREQSRIGVHDSEDDHAGSAHGYGPPSEGTVQMPPPTAVTKVETAHQSVQSQPSQYYSPPEPQYQGGNYYFSPPGQE
ncbi:hypothetical protein JCGZ_18259 [Jatropha curcas]|uniref:Uncharacterized protein n=1 Tax=Jatropha curcas TaxID=180498 RepID=A0A067K2T0_JATCU|nr:interleukin enhancer-binding factor 3-B [Jatropha curcas]KDP29338.1 hypothetical protein JCGZ_18259 [Jatropha curcas]